MLTTNLESGAIQGHAFVPVAAAEPARSVRSLILELAKCLERLPHDGTIPPTEEPLELWADDECTYLEADLPSLAEAEIDINIYNGRLFVRLIR